MRERVSGQPCGIGRIGPAAVVLLALAVACSCSGQSSPAAFEPAFLNMDESVEWVGRETCRQCHFEKHATYTHTGMGMSLCAMTPEIVVEDFELHNEIVVEPSGVRYRMERRDDRFFQRQFVLDSRGQEIAAAEHELIWVVGSNNHSRSYLIELEGKLFQAPVCWYPDPSKWELCPGFEVNNELFTREIGLDCLHCHNGRMETLPGARNAFERPFPMGIGCERCHGPGQLHVERWKRGDDTPSGGLDPTIVNPRRLPTAERIEVCYQCHMGDAKATQRVVRHDRSFASFRPGQRITDVMVPFRFKDPTEYDFGLSAQADRLMLSRCFDATGGRLECLTCHNPHVTVYHEERPEDFFKQRCLTCHTTESCVGPEREREATDPSDDCVACHMRRAEPDDQRFTEFTDHWIRRDIRIDAPDARKSYEIEPVFPARFAELSRSEQSYYRARALSLISAAVPTAARTAMLRDAVDAFRAAISEGYDTANAWYFLGKAQRSLGRTEQAAEAFETAHLRDAEHRDAAYAVGQQRLDEGDARAGLAIFRAMIDRDPADAPAFGEAGRASMMLGDSGQALDYFRTATRLQPWSASMRLNRGRVLASLGRFVEAADQGEWAVRWKPDDAEAWEFYENVMLAAEREADAREGRLQRERLERTAASDRR
jgi:tetratricopeptide (TPR) repeat protein